MQRRTWLWLLATALTAGALYVATRPGPRAAAPPHPRVQPALAPAGKAAVDTTPQPVPATAPVPLPEPPTTAAGLVPPGPALPPVTIQDHTTLDFSSGIVQQRDTAADQAALDAALKEMEEATKNVTFPAAPAVPPPAPPP